MTKEIATSSGILDLLPEGSGLEKVTQQDIIIPRLRLLQDLSPQLQEDDPTYVAGAKSGMMLIDQYGMVTTSVVVALAKYDKTWVEWAPRETGEGIVRVHEEPPEEVQSPDNEIKETSQFYGWVIQDREKKLPEPLPITLMFSGSQLRAARQILTYAMSTKVPSPSGGKTMAPLVYMTYILTTERRQNKSGRWWGYRVQQGEKLETFLKDDPESMLDIFESTQAMRQWQSTPQVEHDHE